MSSVIKVDTISENTSANGVVIDSVTLKDGGVTATAASTITVADNTDNLTLTSTDADASSGPNIVLNRDSGSPADNDIVGQFTFRADNDAGEATDYCRFRVHLDDVTDGEEDGNFRLFTLVAGSEVSRIDIDKDETVFNEDSVDIDFRVESNGNQNMLRVKGDVNCVLVGTGTDRTSAELQVSGSQHNTRCATFEHSADPNSAAPYGINIEYSGGAPDSDSDTANQAIKFFDNSGSTRFVVAGDGDVLNHDNSYGQLSDERIKTNIVDANSQWDDIKALKVRNFERKDDVEQHGAGSKVQIGVIAQELETAGMGGLLNEGDPTEIDIKHSSEFGELNEDGTIKSTTGEKVKSVKYSVLYIKAIKALQEAMAKIETLETKVKALEDA